MENRLILAGDIGGTKTLLQLAEVRKTGIVALLEQRYNSQAFAGLIPMIADLLQEAGSTQVGAACLGVAGPVSKGRAQITNLPWSVDAAEIGAAFSIPKVRLINDFQAVAYGIETLDEKDFVTLQTGQAALHGTRAVIGAGTGLGEGFMVWQGDHYEALPSEGSHGDFAPVDVLQIELQRYLASRFGHVSYERIVSGPGLIHLVEFLRDSGHGQASPELTLALVAATDRAAAITEYALNRQDPLAMQALRLFVRIYGAEAGNLALKVLATGGVYVAGGIAPKIIEQLQQGDFMDSFTAKGRFSDLLSSIPVRVVLNPQAGLMGALAVAARM